jgi:hypothetical protein
LWALRSTEGSNPSPSAVVGDLQALRDSLRPLPSTPGGPSRPQKGVDLCSAVQRTCSATLTSRPLQWRFEVAVEEARCLLLGAREEVAVAVERDRHGVARAALPLSAGGESPWSGTPDARRGRHATVHAIAGALSLPPDTSSRAAPSATAAFHERQQLDPPDADCCFARPAVAPSARTCERSQPQPSFVFRCIAAPGGQAPLLHAESDSG